MPLVGFLALLEMVGRRMEDALAMPRAVRWGDIAANAEDTLWRGRNIHCCLIDLKQA